MNMFQVAEKALEILGHPLGALPEPEYLLRGDVKDQLRLVVLAG